MKKIRWIFFIISFISCVDSNEFDTLNSSCQNNQVIANTTFLEVKALYSDKIIKIQSDLIIEGYVISNDQAGNFFGSLRIQDNPINPTEGLQIDIDLRDSHLFYGEGKKVLVKLKDLYLGESNGVYKLGGIFTNAGGTLSVGRLPTTKVKEHVFNSCDEIQKVEPKITLIEELDDSMLNTLVQLENFQVAEEDLNQLYAIPEENTDRTLKNCDGVTITLRNSGYSDFQNEILPSGSGSIIGVLGKYKNTYQLTIRNVDDIMFSNTYIDCHANDSSVFISELSDPENNIKARFIELYNSSNTDINFNGWELRRYTNESLDVSSRINLSKYTINAKSTFVIAANALEFETVYGFVPDLESPSSSSPANSNGDDNMELVNSKGTIIDVFGTLGEDGSNTNHEFEDGRAIRNIGIIQGNPIYIFSEWTIYNDTGNLETINLPQQAPTDFTPGVR